MRSRCLDKNDSEHLCQTLPGLLQPFHSYQRVHLIWDGGPSHTSAATLSFLRSHYGAWLRILPTPAHASWLNQAGLLLKSFEVRYLQRGNWESRQQLIDHLCASAPEYNRLWAQPINRAWTRRDLHDWAEKNLPDYVKLLIKQSTSPELCSFVTFVPTKASADALSK